MTTLFCFIILITFFIGYGLGEDRDCVNPPALVGAIGIVLSIVMLVVMIIGYKIATTDFNSITKSDSDMSQTLDVGVNQCQH